MPKISPSQMVQDFLKIKMDNPNFISLTEKENNTGKHYHVSGEIFNAANGEATPQYQMMWYITKRLELRKFQTEFGIKCGLSRTTKKYTLVIPESDLPKLDSKEDKALYKTKVLSVNYLLHVHEFIQKNIQKYNQYMDKEKELLKKDLDGCDEFLFYRPDDQFFKYHSKYLSEDLNSFDKKFITEECSNERWEGIEKKLKLPFTEKLWSKQSEFDLTQKESVFCKIFHATSTKQVSEIIQYSKYTLSETRKSSLEEKYKDLEYYKLVGIVATFPISVPILCGLSYKKRASFYFYKPGSRLCVEAIEKEIENVPKP